MRDRAVEILAPAGSYESMKAAVNAGADAVYIGGSRFGARAYADNLNEDRMLEAIDYVHLYGRRIYLTVNTLVKEEELSELCAYLNPYYERGLDAVIVQDLGVLSYIREVFPDLPIHASTQMSITGPCGARLLKELGVKRIVTARELSLEEISKIRDGADVEIEAFVHGALCYCYSGQCLMSSLIGGRSGNRGRCAQPCRLPYQVTKDKKPWGGRDERYVLSLKDLCALELLPDLIEAGVCSLKIEGRMKSPRYTAGTVCIYRKYVDMYVKNGRMGYTVDPEDKKTLLDLFDRGGFTEGYCRQSGGREMVALREKPDFREGNQELFEYLDSTYVEATKQVTATGAAYLAEGKPARFSLSCKDASVSVEGAVVQRAQNQPLTRDKMERQLGKTGGTPFVFDDLEVQIVGDVFLPVQAVNQLRRSGLAALESELLAPRRRPPACPAPPELVDCAGNRGESGERDNRKAHSAGKVEWKADICVSVSSEEAIPVILEAQAVSRVYLDSCVFGAKRWRKLSESCHRAGKQCFLAMPHVFRAEAIEYFKGRADDLIQAGFDGVVVSSLDEVGFLSEAGINLPILSDASLYIFNNRAAGVLASMGVLKTTLPAELNARELKALGCQGRELMAYGRLPLMVSAQCVARTVEGCDKRSKTLWMKDRMGKEFPVTSQCRFCYNTIYNSSPLSLIGLEEDVRKLRPGSLRLIFTTETPRETGNVIRAYTDAFVRAEKVKVPAGDFTRGHFKRGVE